MRRIFASEVLGGGGAFFLGGLPYFQEGGAYRNLTVFGCNFCCIFGLCRTVECPDYFQEFQIYKFQIYSSPCGWSNSEMIHRGSEDELSLLKG